MIKFKKVNYNLILGALIGVVLAQIVIFEGYAVIAQKEITTGFVSIDYENLIMRRFEIAAGIVFLVTLILFNTKVFKKIKLDRMSIYLILVIVISLFVAVEGSFTLASITLKGYSQGFMEEPFIAINLVYGIFILGIIMFLTTFVLLVNRKVTYIKFLTKEIKAIKNEGFGKTIKVKGDDELAELCKSINNMSVEIGEKIENEKKIEENKHQLITNISHDLKTPLTSIVGYLEIINNKDIDDKTRDEYINIAYNKSLRLKSLVNELFEYTKLSSNDIKFHEKKVNISMLLNQAVGESIISFSEKNISVVLNNTYKEVFCNVDTTHMLRVFENLIKNAEKYSDPNSEFRVSLKVVDEKVVISFVNRCEEIKDEEIKHFFEKFYVRDSSRSTEGSGLGLAIVERIINLHQGNIEVKKIGNDIKFDIILKKA